jgi:pilus assembly protein Flp/PilA
MTMIQSFVRDEEGAALVEYGILVALIAVVCFLAVQTLGNKINNTFGGINNSLT